MSIEVHVRIRPGVEHCVWSSAETVLYSTVNPNTRYVYNKVHPSNSSNRTIFQGIEAIVHAAYDGKNTTIMAYGQTGSGKTHSMIGVPEDAGIVPRAARLLLELRRQHPETVVQAYYTEIYNESVRDLLEPQRGELQLHDAPDGGVTFDKKTVTVDSFDDFLKLQATAERNRKYGVTNLNDHSSRSHIILTFEITRPNKSARSVLNLVDLAGSESAARANTDGQTLREGGFINRSLLTLGNVVDAIVEKRSHVPYRAAKLTRVLRTCLGGSGITLILCCVNPSRENLEQTVSALRFTQRAMKIRNDPVVVLPLPPLFTHQYSESAKQLIDGMQECSASEYQRGLRDAYMYCNSTCHSVVTDFKTNVAESLHSLANAQRLLVAHEHAMAIDRIGRLYVQVSEEARQKTQNESITSDERRRQRDAAEQIDERRAKLARLEVEVQEKTCTADTDLAGWEYQLRTAKKKEVNELALLVSKEQTRRARIFYEWAVCMERIAARCSPQGEALFFNELEAQQRAATQEAADTARSPAPQIDHDTAMLAEDEEEENSKAAKGAFSSQGSGTTLVTAAALRNPPSKTTTLKEMRVRLAQAREEVAQLELAHGMVVEDINQAKEEQRRKKKNAGSASQPSSTGGGVVGELDEDEEALLLSTYEGVPDTEIERQLRQLEDDEKHLMAKARRDVRNESLRRVRESLRLHRTASSQAVSRASPPSNSRGRELYPGEVVEEDDVDNEHARNAKRGDADNELPSSQKSRDRRRASPTPTTTQSRTRGASPFSSSAELTSAPTSQLEVADYNAEVNNALSVLEQLRHHLLSQQGGRHGGHEQGSSAATRHRQAQRQSPTPPLASTTSTSRADGVHTRPPRVHERDVSRMPSDVPLVDLFDVSQESQYSQQPASDKENAYRGVTSSAAHRPRSGMPTKAGQPSTRHYEVVVDSDDDALFDMRDTDESEASRHRAPGREGSPSMDPPVGIAARRRYERQYSSEPPTRRTRTGAAAAVPPTHAVERALYAIPSNSQSPSASMERRSRSRRQY